MGACTCFLYPPTVGVSGSNTGFFTLAMPLTPAKGNLDHTSGECNVQRAAGFVQLHAHDPLVFYSVIAALFRIVNAHLLQEKAVI